MNDIQKLYIELIRRTSHNALDGKRVAHDLVEHQNLWRSAVVWRHNSLIVLRDLPEAFHNVDTLYMVPVCGKEQELKELAQYWDADSVEYLAQLEAEKLLGTGKDIKVLQCWWD